LEVPSFLTFATQENPNNKTQGGKKRTSILDTTTVDEEKTKQTISATRLFLSNLYSILVSSGVAGNAFPKYIVAYELEEHTFRLSTRAWRDEPPHPHTLKSYGIEWFPSFFALTCSHHPFDLFFLCFAVASFLPLIDSFIPLAYFPFALLRALSAR
jgi:hypothetical protein